MGLTLLNPYEINKLVEKKLNLNVFFTTLLWNMNENKWEIQKYVTDTEMCPFDQWFEKLDIQTQVRVDVRLDRVSLGNFGDYKSVGKEFMS